MKIFSPAFALSLWLLGGCDQLGSSQIEVRNSSNAPLAAVQADVGGKRIEIGLINAGQVVKIDFAPVSDSGVRISYSADSGSRPLSCTGDVYITTGLRQHLIATIGPDQNCRIEEAK